jgi:hypothetical protein
MSPFKKLTDYQGSQKEFHSKKNCFPSQRDLGVACGPARPPLDLFGGGYLSFLHLFFLKNMIFQVLYIYIYILNIFILFLLRVTRIAILLALSGA